LWWIHQELRSFEDASSRGRSPWRSVATYQPVLLKINYLCSKQIEMKRGGFIYITTNKNNTVLYTGVTSDLFKRINEHKAGYHPNSFTKRYNVTKLVYFEAFPRIEEAIAREKQIKSGPRQKKIALIENMNPEWIDLLPQVKT
jgi:putative endonuclease